MRISPDISLPEAGLAVLHVPLVVAHSHGGVVSVVTPERIASHERSCLHLQPSVYEFINLQPVREAIMDSPVPGPACQCGDASNPGDDGEGGDNLPPHPEKQATL